MSEKRRLGPKTTMKGLPKASIAKVNFLSLPKEVETTFDTGHGEHNNSKWEMDIELLEHPNQEPGVMVWQTTAEVIRKDIMTLVKLSNAKELPELKKDLFQINYWSIEADESGVINLVEL